MNGVSLRVYFMRSRVRASTVLTAAICTKWVTTSCMSIVHCTCEESRQLNNRPAEELLFDSEWICLFAFWLAGSCENDGSPT